MEGYLTKRGHRFKASDSWIQSLFFAFFIHLSIELVVFSMRACLADVAQALVRVGVGPALLFRGRRRQTERIGAPMYNPSVFF